MSFGDAGSRSLHRATTSLSLAKGDVEGSHAQPAEGLQLGSMLNHISRGLPEFQISIRLTRFRKHFHASLKARSGSSFHANLQLAPLVCRIRACFISGASSLAKRLAGSSGAAASGFGRKDASPGIPTAVLMGGTLAADVARGPPGLQLPASRGVRAAPSSLKPGQPLLFQTW